MKLKDLTIPCAYQGGKQRLAKQIVDIIYEENEINEDTHFYDICCGSGSVSIELVKRGFNPKNITMIDAGEWGLFWSDISNGDFIADDFKEYINDIPKDITQIQSHVKELAKQNAMFETSYKFLILQASSFGSKPVYRLDDSTWKTHGFRNYWLPTETSNRRSHVNPMMPMPDTLLERVENITHHMDEVNAFYMDVMDLIHVKDNSIIYIDPPYKNTSGYGYDLDIHSLINQLKTGNELHNRNCKFYVSEGYELSENATMLSKGRNKGGISGDRNKANEEWLSRFI